MSGSAIGLTITADDKTAKTIAAVNANVSKFASATQKNLDKFAATAQSRMNQATASMRRYTDGLGKVNNGLRGMARAGADAFQKIGQIVPVLGIITGAASIEGMSRMVSQWGEWGLKISNTARQIGVGAKTLTGWEGAAKLAGGSADAMASGLQTLGQNLYDAAGGRNTGALVMLSTLFGRNFQANAHTALELMPKIADKIAGVRDPFVRAQIGVELFGGAWQGLEPLLVLGSKRMAELEAASERYNHVTAAGIESGKDLALAQREVGLAAEGLQNRISERLAPVLTPMLKHFADWIATSPVVTRMVNWLGDAVERLGRWIEGINWDKVGEQASAWAEKLKGVLDLLQRVGILPTIDTSGGQQKPAQLPTGSPLATPDNPAAVQPPDNRSFLERLYKPGPGLLDGIFGPPAANPQAPNGVPKTGPAFGTQQPVDPANAGAPRGIRNNNPLNLGFVPGQVGLVSDAPSDGRFGRYRTMEEGVAQAERQLQRYQTRDHLDTVRKMISKWAPPNENDTDSYVQAVSRAMGVDPDAPVSLNNQATAAAMISAMARRETGRSLDPAVVNRGVGLALDPVAPQAQGAPMQLASASGSGSDGNSQSTVRVEFGGKLPTGLNMQVQNPNKVDVGGPLVTQPQLLGAMP